MTTLTFNWPTKTQWIAALRSGRYVQGQYALQRPDGANCCIGVLCREAGLVATPNVYGQMEFTLNGEPRAANIPSYRLPPYMSAKQQDTLMMMNDEDRKTFPEIADYIEANL